MALPILSANSWATLGGPDSVLVAGDDEGLDNDKSVVGFLGLRQRFARTREAFSILAHMAFTDEGDRNRVVIRGCA